MQLMIVEHETKGQGLVVDRISNVSDEGFVVRLGVSFFEQRKPAVEYVDPDELAFVDFIDSVDDLEDDEEEEEQEEEEQGS